LYVALSGIAIRPVTCIRAIETYEGAFFESFHADQAIPIPEVIKRIHHHFLKLHEKRLTFESINSPAPDWEELELFNILSRLPKALLKLAFGD
jgi:hypothetical protein